MHPPAYAARAAAAAPRFDAPPAGTARTTYDATYADHALSVSVAPVAGKFDVDQLVVRRRGAPDQHIPVEMHIGSITKILRAGPDRLVAILTSTQPYAGVAVIDITRGTVLDSFACYDPAVSPDGHFVAFRKFYPPHFADDADDYSDFALVYDLRKTHAENLDPRRLYDGPRSPDADIGGFLAYPRDWQLQNFAPDPAVRIGYGIEPPYVWSNDSTKLLFTAVHAPAGTLPGDAPPGRRARRMRQGEKMPAATQLVLVDLSTGRPVTRALTVHDCPAGPIPACGLVLAGARFQADGVKIGMRRATPAADSQTFPYKDFRPL